jgi:hypothetical protein
MTISGEVRLDFAPSGVRWHFDLPRDECAVVGQGWGEPETRGWRASSSNLAPAPAPWRPSYIVLISWCLWLRPIKSLPGVVAGWQPRVATVAVDRMLKHQIRCGSL